MEDSDENRENAYSPTDQKRHAECGTLQARAREERVTPDETDTISETGSMDGYKRGALLERAAVYHCE